METFDTRLTGNTLDAHLAFVSQLKEAGGHQVNPREKSDVTIVFCPVTSRAGTDVSAALSKISGFKPVILVVMHHTYDPGFTVVDSSRLVDNSAVILTVDCLFHDSRGLLECPRNKDAVSDVLKKMDLPKKGVSIPTLKRQKTEERFKLLEEQQKCQELQKELQKANETINNQAQQIKGLQAEVKTLKEQNSPQTADVFLLDVSKPMFKWFQDLFKTEERFKLLEEQQKCQELQKELQKANETINNQAQQIKELQAEVKTLKEQNSSQTAGVSIPTLKRQDTDERFKLLEEQQKCQELQKELQKANETINNQAQQIKERFKLLEEQLLEKDQQIKELQAEVKTLKGQNSSKTAAEEQGSETSDEKESIEKGATRV